MLAVNIPQKQALPFPATRVWKYALIAYFKDIDCHKNPMQHRELWDRKFRRIIGNHEWLETIKNYCYRGMRMQEAAASDHVRVFEAFNAPDFDLELVQAFETMS